MILGEKKENISFINEKEKNVLKDNNTSATKENTLIPTVDKNDYSNRKNLISTINDNIPEFFEKFDLLEYINSGSAGYVYKGIYKSKIKKDVALKFLINKKQKDKMKKDKDINSQEIVISKKLHNQNVTETYAYFKKKDINFSVMEYGKHGDIEHFLKNLLKRRFYSETFLNYLTKQILDGLKYIHKCKIVHMDIKPGNILLDSNLEAKITDFSVSCQYNSFHPEDLVKFPFVGTGKFISPEVLSKAHMKIKEAEKIDMYSLGVTLYYLYYGQFPYNLNNVKGKDYENILNNINNEELIFPKERKKSKLFEDFLRKILEKNYEKRLNIREALKHPWIEGSKIIFDEKENISCNENFLIKLITDCIPKFNEYIS